MHEGKIYSWTSLNKESKNDDIVLVSKTTSIELLSISHGQYIFFEDIMDSKGKLCRQNINKLQTNFSMYQIVTYVTRVSNSRDKI